MVGAQYRASFTVRWSYHQPSTGTYSTKTGFKPALSPTHRNNQVEEKQHIFHKTCSTSHLDWEVYTFMFTHNSTMSPAVFLFVSFERYRDLLTLALKMLLKKISKRSRWRRVPPATRWVPWIMARVSNIMWNRGFHVFVWFKINGGDRWRY